MGTAEIAAFGALLGAVIAVLGLAGTAIYRMGKLSQEVVSNRELLEGKGQQNKEALEQQIRQNKEALEQQIQHSREILEQQIRQDREYMERQFQQQEQRFQRHEENIELRFQRQDDLIRSESEKNRAEIRRLYDAIMSHTHAADGNVVFRVPPSGSEE